MKIAIIGAGNVGGAIARGLAGKGHDVTLGVRDPNNSEVRTLANTTGASPALPAQAAAKADIIILALPWNVTQSAVEALGPLTSKIIIDCTNPLEMIEGTLQLSLGHSISGGEIVQGWIPRARVVKTLNQVGAEMMADNSSLPVRPVMFMAGDDDAAKRDVATLLNDLGFAPHDAGDLIKARLLEPFGMVWINQALVCGKGRNWALAAVDG